VLDQRGQFVLAAVGFATLPLPSYNRVRGVGSCSPGIPSRSYRGGGAGIADE